MSQLNNAYGDEYLIPLVWETGDSFGNSRYWWYPGNGYVPWVIFGGSIEPTWNNYASYVSAYNYILNINSPLEIDFTMDLIGEQLLLTADITVTGNITSANNKVFFLISKYTPDASAEYVNKVVAYSGETNFYLTQIGQSVTEEHLFTLDPGWALPDIFGVVVVQSWLGRDILQAAQTSFTGLIALFDSNVQVGPAYLGVQFTDYSLPEGDIVSWEWDFDGDGVYDSTEKNPYHLYEIPSEYDVTLRVYDGVEYSETTKEDYITVTDGSNISGNVSGIWIPDFSPYNITEDISIEEDDALVIEPGVEVIAEDECKIKVQGLLQADASDSEPIIFTSESQWEGIHFFFSLKNNLIKNCHISKANVSAIDIEDSKVDIIDNIIFENSSSTSKGPAVNVYNSDDVTIHNNQILNNTSSNLSSGIGCNNSSPIISYNLIANNIGAIAGAISIKNISNATILNNTIANNQANSCIVFMHNSSPVITNSIIVDSINIFALYNGTPEVTYTCISGGYTGIGNIDENPLFVNPDNGDYHLTEASPCIDTGDPNSPLDPDGTRADMGAFYFNQLTNVDGNIPENKNVLRLYQNFPNPLSVFSNTNLNGNNTTTIKYYVHQLSYIELKVYNIKGKLIRTLVADIKEAGTYDVNWNGEDEKHDVVPSGLYFYQIKVKSDNNNFTETKKMLILER